MTVRIVQGLLAGEDRLVTATEACAGGVEPRDLQRLVRTGRLVRVRRGVYTDADHWTELDEWVGRPMLRVRAAHLTLHVPHVFSHDSAALLHGLGVPHGPTALVHVTRERVLGDRLDSGIKHHGAVYHPDQETTTSGLPVLDLARTALDMAREHGFSAGLAVADPVLRRGVPRSELWRAVEMMRCWRHVRAVREVIDLADGGSESWLESEGRALVLHLGIGRPQTQFGLTDGARTAYADIRRHRHLFEVDGLVKLRPVAEGGLAESPTDVLRRQKERQDFLTGFKLGYSTITARDLGAGRHTALRRLRREYDDMCRRFGTDIGDVAPYVVRRRSA